MGKRTVIPIGPYHPLLEEPEFFKLYCDGEIVKDMVWETGYNHRGIEKICQTKTFEQVFFVVERICGICSTSHPFAYANAVESIPGIEIPERAKYIRSIVGELERIHSHLLWVGLAGHFLGYNTVFMWAWKYREPVLDMFEIITGNRNSYAMFTIGGVRRDIDAEQATQLLSVLEDVKIKTDLLVGAVMDDPVIHARLKGVGVLTAKDIHDFGAVGPTARASNVDIDVRRDDPYAAYDMIDWKVITAQAGDVFAKAEVRLLEMYESISIIKQCLEALKKTEAGDIKAKVNEIPPGIGIGHAEAPRGEVFHFVKSDGGNSPVRHKIRAPSYTCIPTFRKSCIGGTVSDAAIATAAVDPCYCCTERMTQVYDHSSGKHLMNSAELIKLSQQKTKELKAKMKV
ncbi:MAG: nickel-dependent hydrogenase large subunit [Candidatus Cloacimonetes bacterium]|jgi:membrane-bound hydrogenase subunit alpha|nr:nickel-dependent hydrogenase large subunit [Candidatus Cloacimonadota bacterium]